MNSITIFPENEQQDSLMRNLLEQLKIRFEIRKNSKEPLVSEEETDAQILVSELIKGEESGFVKDFDRTKFKQRMRNSISAK